MAYTLYAGKTYTILEEASSTADVVWKDISVSSDGVLVSLWVDECAGDLDLIVYTQDNSGHETVALAFPTITGATSEILIRKTSLVVSRIRVEATYTGAARFKVSVKGINASEIGAKAVGASSLKTSQVDVGTTPVELFPVDVEARNGLIIKNSSVGLQVLYIAESEAACLLTSAYPLQAGESLGIALAPGQSVWGRSDTGVIDTRMLESGA